MRDDNDHHGHDHSVHDHAPASFGKAFAIGIALNAGFVLVEVVYGILGNSVALLADAGHNLGDVLGCRFPPTIDTAFPTRADPSRKLLFSGSPIA